MLMICMHLFILYFKTFVFPKFCVYTYVYLKMVGHMYCLPTRKNVSLDNHYFILVLLHRSLLEDSCSSPRVKFGSIEGWFSPTLLIYLVIVVSFHQPNLVIIDRQLIIKKMGRVLCSIKSMISYTENNNNSISFPTN